MTIRKCKINDIHIELLTYIYKYTFEYNDTLSYV